MSLSCPPARESGTVGEEMRRVIEECDTDDRDVRHRRPDAADAAARQRFVGGFVGRA